MDGITEVGVFCGVCHRWNDGASDFCACRESLIGYRTLNAKQVASWVSGQMRERDAAGAPTTTDEIEALRIWAGSGQPLHAIADSGGRMSDKSEGPGWWLASDGRWYPPQPHIAPVTPTTNGLAIASLVVGYVGIALTTLVVLLFIAGGPYMLT
jgi:hypothetical protein